MNTKKNLRAVMLMLFLCACQRTPEASSRPEDLSFSSLSSFRSSVSSTQSIQSSSSSLSSVSSSISSSSSVQSSAASSGSSSSAASSGISSQPEAPVSSAPSSEAVSDTGSDASSAPLPVPSYAVPPGNPAPASSNIAPIPTPIHRGRCHRSRRHMTPISRTCGNFGIIYQLIFQKMIMHIFSSVMNRRISLRLELSTKKTWQRSLKPMNAKMLHASIS